MCYNTCCHIHSFTHKFTHWWQRLPCLFPSVYQSDTALPNQSPQFTGRSTLLPEPQPSVSCLFTIFSIATNPSLHLCSGYLTGCYTQLQGSHCVFPSVSWCHSSGRQEHIEEAALSAAGQLGVYNKTHEPTWHQDTDTIWHKSKSHWLPHSTAIQAYLCVHSSCLCQFLWYRNKSPWAVPPVWFNIK